MTLRLVYSAASSKDKGPVIKAQDCALVVMHLQNHTVDPTHKNAGGRAMRSALSSQMTQKLATSVFEDVVPAFHRRNIDVFLIGREVPVPNSGGGRNLVAEMFYQYAPQKNDTVIFHEGMTPFADGLLERHLRAGQKKHVYFAGIGADPYAPLGLTARESVQRGFHTVLLSDKIHTHYNPVHDALAQLSKHGVDHCTSLQAVDALSVFLPRRPPPILRLV